MSANPTPQLERDFAFESAIERSGGQIGLAKIVGRTQGAISKRLNAGLPIWHDVVFAVEAATGISRHDLRPDIYPRDVANSSGEAANSDQTGAA